MNIILFGPPGAGKGTQADILVQFYELHKVSTGDLLRDEIKNNTDLGSKIKFLIDRGELVSDDIINNLIIKILSNKKFYNRLIFDGYPRNLNQAKKLDLLLKEYKQKISSVFSLEVNRESIIKRVIGRQICSSCGLIFNKYYKPAISKNHTCDPKYLNKRSDDNESTIINRFETWSDITLPILNYYKQQNLLHQINGMGEINEIFEKIHVIIASLEA